MNKYFLLALCLMMALLTSCNFTEEITFKEDGSGEFLMSYDMSEVMKTFEEMGGAEKKENEEKEAAEKIDSVVYFKDMLVENADSIAKLPKEEQEHLKSLESVMMRFKVDEAEGLFDFGIGSTFNSLEELPEVMEKIEKAKKLNSKGNAQFSQMDQSAVAKSAEGMFEYLDFSYDGKTFSRQLKKDFKRSEEEMKAFEDEMNQMGGESKEFFQKMNYTLVYHFPKPIKSVSNSSAELSNGGKTVTLKMNFVEMMKSPELMNLKVELED